MKEVTEVKLNKKPKLTEEQAKGLEIVKEIARKMKKKYKPLSKSKLIEIIITYASDLQEMQQLAKHLYEENKKLKENQCNCEEVCNENNS